MSEAPDVADNYTYWLAIEDILPIVFAGFGFYWFTQRVRSRFPELTVPVAFAAVILVVGSAFAGPTRKMFLAGGAKEASLDWAQIPFFSAMPIGFAILFWAVLCLLKDRKLSFLPFGIALAVLFALASWAERSIILIAVGGLFGVAMGLAAAVLAKRQGGALTSALFVVYSLAVLLLPILGSSEDREEVSHQWLEQGTNTVAMGLFALAAYRLLREHQRAGNRSVLVEN